MLDIQDLEGNVLHQCRKDMDVIVSYHQFPKTQTTQNSKRKQKTQKLRNWGIHNKASGIIMVNSWFVCGNPRAFVGARCLVWSFSWECTLEKDRGRPRGASELLSY